MNNGEEFLRFVADNEHRLRRNLAKNITYDVELFDDVFATTIIKVYNSIINNNKVIDDFEKYFFISSKFEYILWDNRKKKAKAVAADISEARHLIDDDEETDDDELCELVSEMKNYLIEQYGEFETNVFLQYFIAKSQKKCSYKMIAEEFDINIKECCSIITKIKADEQLKEYHNKFRQIKQHD